MQKKATPVREGVVVIDQSTSMKQLKEFADKCEQEFGIKTFQIHMHKDEGHKRAETWKPNYHAHIVFDWTDEKGKSIKLKPNDMAQMQTLLADSLKMERGVSSDRKHLNSLQYKNAAEEQRMQELQEAIKLNSEELSTIRAKKSTQKLISKTSEKILDVLGSTRSDKEKKVLKTNLKSISDENNRLRAGVEQNYNVAERFKEKYSLLQQDYETLNNNHNGLKAKHEKAINFIRKVANDIVRAFGADAVIKHVPQLERFIPGSKDKGLRM